MLLEDELRLQAPAPDNAIISDPVVVGKPGLGVWFYWIATHYPIGITFSGPVGIWNAPGTLNVQNYVHISWAPAMGAISYDVLRTSTAIFPNGPANIALATGITQTTWDDHGATPTSYNPNGFPHGAPVAARIYLNNRDNAQPVLQITDPIMFPDGSIQSTAGGGGTVGPQGPPGPQGPAGSAVAILGSVPTVADLPATGNTLNDAYIVEASGHLYVWNGTAWIDAGPIVGPQGPAGPVGPAGPAGGAGATGPAGPAGPTGATGATGAQGPPGAQGPAGPTGPAGTGSYNWTQNVTANGNSIVGLGTLGLGPGGGTVPVQISNSGGSMVFQTNTPYGLMYFDVNGNLGIGNPPQGKLTIWQRTNNIGGGIRLVSALGGPFWDIYFGSGDALFLENDESGTAQAILGPGGALTLNGNFATLNFTTGILMNNSGNLITTSGQFVGAGGVNTAGQVVAGGGFSYGAGGNFPGVTDTFATGDGRTATVRGGIITQIA